MSIPLDPFCFAAPINMIFSGLFFTATSVGIFEWPISATAACMDVAFCQFSNNPPNSDLVADSMMFLTILHSKYTSPFSRDVAVIGMLDFGGRKKIRLL